MFKTIFSKLILIFIAILIFSFSVTGIMLYYFLGKFVTSEKVDLLKNSADKINSYLNIYMENQDSPLIKKAFEYVLESYSTNTNSYIWVVNSNGYIVFYKPDTPESIALMGKLKDETGNLRLGDKEQYRKVMLGQVPVVEERGDFYGFFKDTGVSWLTIEKPFKHNEKVMAAIYLHTPIPEVHRVRTSVFRFFMFSVWISVLISIVLAYFFSLKITRPLKEINAAAREISGGEFQKRLAIESNDEIGELAASFNNMVHALQNLEQMRRGFIANVSHELRTPMTSIRGFIEGILDGTIPQEKHKDYLTIVRDEANRLNRLVNNLLDLAKMEAGELPLKFKTFNVNELLRRTVIKLENQIVDKNIQIEANFDEEELVVSADIDAIERVIINLLHNAVKFTPEEGNITISTTKSKGKALISIKDDGIGIENAEINLIWDRFFKSDKSRSKDKSGTGLGLAIVKNIISEHNQEICVESEIGKGTKFSFTLKLENDSAEHI